MTPQPDPVQPGPRRYFTASEVTAAWLIQDRKCRICARDVPRDLVEGDARPSQHISNLRHRAGGAERQPLAGHGGAIVDRAGAGHRGVGGDRADAGPVVAAHAGFLEDLFAERILRSAALFRRSRRRRRSS